MSKIHEYPFHQQSGVTLILIESLLCKQTSVQVNVQHNAAGMFNGFQMLCTPSQVFQLFRVGVTDVTKLCTYHKDEGVIG